MRGTCGMLSPYQQAMMRVHKSAKSDLYMTGTPNDATTRPAVSCSGLADLQMFTGLCYALLGPDGKVSKSLHLALNEPKSAPMHWTGFSRGSG